MKKKNMIKSKKRRKRNSKKSKKKLKNRKLRKLPKKEWKILTDHMAEAGVDRAREIGKILGRGDIRETEPQEVQIGTEEVTTAEAMTDSEVTQIGTEMMTDEDKIETEIGIELTEMAEIGIEIVMAGMTDLIEKGRGKEIDMSEKGQGLIRTEIVSGKERGLTDTMGEMTQGQIAAKDQQKMTQLSTVIAKTEIE